MPKARRGEIWIADLGMVAKVRPVLVLSVPYENNERAVVTCVVRTTSVRETPYEVAHRARGMQDGAFDAQGLVSIPEVKLERRLGVVAQETLLQVEEAVRAWLGFQYPPNP
jgi:mRNA interferase MazF